ncbi:hypothetical protein BpHYR1_033063 [Brachionus plicatilis]|uniref:Uncharacterized protein n=1 Tax=Brachionus plicatilis TaxID=10195 RepID=A0A3M7RIJ0_BRAPC|nr:hypothetical protein BpHYR1_033063 [Brachionus plicatilis]
MSITSQPIVDDRLNISVKFSALNMTMLHEDQVNERAGRSAERLLAQNARYKLRIVYNYLGIARRYPLEVGLVLLVRMGGVSAENSCLPVQSGLGLRMAGWGNFPSHLGKNSTKFIMLSLSKNTSRLVILRTAVSVSCTMPITGRFDCGVMICRGTIINSETSARVSTDCGKCKFISSPSKSALYGVVQLKFMRNVDHGNTLTLWPIMLILCKVGCRLNTIKSPSIMCLSTTYPYCSVKSLVLG